MVTGRVDVMYSIKGGRRFLRYKISFLEAPVGVQFNVARGSNSDVHVFAQTTIGFKIDARIDYNDTGDDDELPEAEDLDFGSPSAPAPPSESSWSMADTRTALETSAVREL